MSNLISHPKQDTVINLDNVASIYRSSTSPIAMSVFFTMNSMAQDERMDEEWKFKTCEEAGEVYDKILDSFVTEIN
jgi:hypothetical protein